MASLFDQFPSVYGVGDADDRVEVDLGAGTTALRRSTRVLDLRPGPQGIVPADGPVRWEALDELPHLLTVEWAGPPRGIVEAVAARPGVQFLYWSDAQGDVDLTATHLGSVRLDGPELRSVRLPSSVRQLSLGRVPAEFGPNPRMAMVGQALEVDAPEHGHGLDLRLFHFGADIVIPEGVRRASDLWLWVGGQLSATVLAGMSDLEALRITFDRAPGEFDDLAELGRCDICSDPVGVANLVAVCWYRLQQTDFSRLIAAVLADQVGRYPVQPRPSVRACEVIPMTPTKSG